MLLPWPAAAHPGKTNSLGGHRCLKDCAEWDLYYGEYHLHDKQGKPIRVQAKKKAKKDPSEVVPQPAAEPSTEVTPPQAVRQAFQPVTMPPSQEVEPCLSSLSGGLLALLLLWLLVRRRRSREQ